MRMIIRKLVVLCVIPISLLSFALVTRADDVDNAMASTGFSYKIQYPDNQREKSGSLKLDMSPSQNQQVEVVVENYADEEITINLSVNGARTNGNGVLEYGPSQFDKDKSMVYDLPDLVSIPESVTVPAKGKVPFSVTIKMPEVAYDGIVTGGIQLQKDETGEASKETNQGGQTIINKVAYLFAVTLTMTDKEVLPELELRKVYPELSNYTNAIYLDIANVHAAKLDNLVLDVNIKKDSGQELTYEKKKANMNMAPNTLMSFPVKLAGEEMVAGDYTADVIATSGEQQWTWTKQFTITSDEADKFNQADVNIVQERGLNWQLIMIIVFASLFVILCLYLLLKQLKKKKKSTKRQSKD